MCGIAGVAWRDQGRTSEHGVVEAMTDRLTHRGPDGDGVWHGRGASLGHRRLSIIDVAGGRQPLSNEDGTVWITFNGEIYDFAALADRLKGLGHVFKTRSDTETIVHGYEEWGAGVVDKLQGMFAFAIWDARNRSLLLARDRFGKKPLLYGDAPSGLAFASELKAVLASRLVERSVRPDALDDYLTYQYVPHPKTIFSGVEKLPPGHVATYRAGRLDVRPYWRPSEVVAGLAPFRDRAAAEAELRTAMTDAVRKRMVSDVPVGCFLSGGIDSTITTGLMAGMHTGQVRSFAIGFPVRSHDETAYAALAAKALDTRHTTEIVDPDAVALLPRIAWHLDEPFGDSSALPTYHVARLARRDVTVALTGDGGDELFLGYDRYRAVALSALADRLPRVARLFLSWFPFGILPSPARQKSRRRRLAKLFSVLAEPASKRYAYWIRIFDPATRAALLAPGMRSDSSEPSEAWLESLLARHAGAGPVATEGLTDVESYLPGDILHKVDMMSMAHGLECRAPFLDPAVAVVAWRMPTAWKNDGFRTKDALKTAFDDLLPPAIRQRGKMGFGVPLDTWFRGRMEPFLRDHLLTKKSRERGWFDPAAVERLLADHVAKRWDHSARLWCLLMLEMWAGMYLDGDGLPDRPSEGGARP